MISNIDAKGIRQVRTDKGALKFYAVRGVNTEGYVRRFGQDEPETVEWIDRYINAGDTLWDIGANIGLYSLYAALGRNVNVYAFEPSALNFGLLTEHVRLNEAGRRIKPLCLALSDRTQLSSLHVREFEVGHACNAAGEAKNQFSGFDPVFSQAVPMMTADRFAEIYDVSPPDHIKLDVDGAEGAILAGAGEILPHVKTIIIEVEGDNADQVETLIEKPLLDAGFEEDQSWREKGSRRNRLYINKRL